jgi:hypothetical protein
MTQARISAALRREVRERARERCEYCLLAESQALFPHEPDHLIARQHGGETVSANLALACFDCNLPLNFIEFQQCVKQHIRAVGDVFGTGEFAGGVADAADARDEDHADWAKAGHVLGIVAGARGHQFGC